MYFFNAHIKHSSDDITSSKFLAANSRANYVPYITVGKMMVKYKGMTSLPMKLGRAAPPARDLCITHPDDSISYIYTKEDIPVKAKPTDSFVSNDLQSVLFHENASYRHARAPLDELYARYSEYHEDHFPPFALFLEINT